MRMKRPLGVIFYQGPSMLDGSPIVAIATLRPSKNVKTGNMVQTWILRADVDPVRAIRTGQDAGICGNCPHRGKRSRKRALRRKRTCYVNVGRAPRGIYRAFKRGRYVPLHMWTHARYFAGRPLRLGAYGEPAAVPARAWAPLLSLCARRTGYTHQWRNASFAWLRDVVMASADSAAERDEARAAGWRTFRVRRAGDPLAPREFVCPASTEAGYRKTCATCLACDGAGWGGTVARGSVAIIVHGASAKAWAV